MKSHSHTISTIYLAMILVGVGLVAICSPSALASSSSTKELVAANNNFALELYSHLAKQSGNFAFSPFSIDSALTMALAGARGNTAKQMDEVLHYASTDTNVHAEYAELLSHLKAIDTTATQFQVANSLWAQRGYPFLKPFQELLRDKYDTSLKVIDLTGWPHAFNPAIAVAARKEINHWAATQTHDKIKQIIPPRLPEPNTRLILVDAVYFKGLWATPFEAKRTKDANFRITPQETVPVPTMHIHGHFPYYEDTNVQALQLWYASGRLSMLILLPKKNDGLAELEKRLADPPTELVIPQSISGVKTYLEYVCQWCTPSEVSVSLPRFTETSGFDLEKPLQAMGIRDAFDDAVADFSGITTVKPFFMEAVIHKAYVSVDEQGTEAAATTAISFANSMGTPQTFTFNADHPFLYLIRDNRTGAILFTGRVVDPSKE